MDDMKISLVWRQAANPLRTRKPAQSYAADIDRVLQAVNEKGRQNAAPL